MGASRALPESVAFDTRPDGQADIYALPPAIAPFQVVVTVTNVKDKELADAGEKMARDLDAAGIDVLLDDRDERAGVKFKDAELIGVPSVPVRISWRCWSMIPAEMMIFERSPACNPVVPLISKVMLSAAVKSPKRLVRPRASMTWGLAF